MSFCRQSPLVDPLCLASEPNWHASPRHDGAICPLPEAKAGTSAKQAHLTVSGDLRSTSLCASLARRRYLPQATWLVSRLMANMPRSCRVSTAAQWDDIPVTTPLPTC